jgi:ABC-2 type transport system permease protein
MSSRPEARIYDLGYRTYEGSRRGPAWALVTVWRHTVQRVLGLRRPFRHKILPGIALLVALAPALVYVGIAGFLPVDLIGENLLPSYAEYYGVITMALILFSSFVAPEALCTDRRTGMLDLYLSGPLDRNRYLVSKWAAVLAVMLLMTTGPQLFMLTSYTIENAGPPLREVPRILLEIAASGIAVALLYTSVSMAVSSFTTRRAVAAVVTALLLIVPSIVVDVVVRDSGAPDALSVLQPGVANEFAWRVFGEAHSADELASIPIARVSTPLVTAALLGWIAAGAFACWFRYRRLERA